MYRDLGIVNHLFLRSREVLRTEGLRGYVAYLKKGFAHKPLLDEAWYVLNYYVRPSRKTIKRIEGSIMQLDLADPGINRSLFLYGYHERESARMYRKVLREGMHVVEIGANIGYYALIAAQEIGSSGRVYAFEPETRNIQQLRTNVELNSYESRVTINQMAVSDQVGRATFAIAPLSNLHQLAIPGQSNTQSIEVPTTTLDEISRETPVDMIRMDVEGAEWLILKGMRKLLSEDQPLKLFIEVHTNFIEDFGGNAGQMLRELGRAGFRIEFLVRGWRSWRGVIPYIKGKGRMERSIQFNQSIEELLDDPKTYELLVSTSGPSEKAPVYYRLFMERH